MLMVLLGPRARRKTLVMVIAENQLSRRGCPWIGSVPRDRVTK